MINFITTNTDFQPRLWALYISWRQLSFTVCEIVTRSSTEAKYLAKLNCLNVN